MIVAVDARKHLQKLNFTPLEHGNDKAFQSDFRICYTTRRDARVDLWNVLRRPF